LQVKAVATAELMASPLPEVRLVSAIASSLVSDTNDPSDFADFAIDNEDRITTERVQMLAPSDLVQLPKGQAFALAHGARPHKLRMPRLSDQAAAQLTVLDRMLEEYAQRLFLHAAALVLLFGVVLYVALRDELQSSCGRPPVGRYFLLSCRTGLPILFLVHDGQPAIAQAATRDPTNSQRAAGGWFQSPWRRGSRY
jgi:hypothetical protein